MKFWKRWKYAYSLFDKLFGKYKKQIILLIALGFLGGFLESIGIGILIPIFALVVKSNVTSGNDAISITITKWFTYFHFPLTLSVLLTVIISIFVFKSIVSLIFSYVNTTTTLGFETDTRSSLYKKALLTSWPYLLKQKIGYLENTLMNDLRNATKLLQGSTSIIGNAASLLAYAFIAVKMSRFITAMTLLVGVMLFFILRPLMTKTRRNTRRQTALSKIVTHHINEHIIGIKTIKAFGSEEKVAQRCIEFYNEIKNVTLRLVMNKNLAGAIMSPVSLIFIVTVFVLSYSRPTFDLAVFIATLYLIQRIFVQINKAQKTIESINDLYPYLSNVVELIDQTEKNQEKVGGSAKFHFSRDLEFRNIGFSYNGKEPVVSKMNFKVKKGEMIGIMGSSGAGKTTIADIFLRLFEPREGEILMDGENIKEIRIDECRRNIGYVPQDSFLLNDTIRVNIKFYDENVSEEDIIEAAKFANIYEFISGLEKGFDTIVGERGVFLSGGQKQRIALARALAKKPAILLLDEATSALDNESEALIQKAIENLKGQTTILVIAHRISTIMKSDRLIVLEGGRVSEEGAPETLLRDKSSYFHKINAI